MRDIVDRKAAHIQICLEDAVESGASHGFDRWQLDTRALPEIALEDVDLSTTIAGKTLQAPLIIGAMTGGTQEAGDINRRLAAAAEAHGIGFALGSGRVILEKPEALDSFAVRDVAPDVLLFANLGAVQFNYGVRGEDAQRLCELTGADALNLHLNPLQEAVQPGGDTNFRDLSTQIEKALEVIQVPVFAKAVGGGIGPTSAALLATLKLAGVETAGVGGTSWSRVEALRADDPVAKHIGLELGALGIPTVASLLACREAFPKRTVIASGGLRSAVDMAKALALGADAVASALPFLKAAAESEAAVHELIAHRIAALRTIHFVCGAKTPDELRGRIRAVNV